MTEHEFSTFETRNGFVGLGWNQAGISCLRLPASTPESAQASVLRRLPHARRAVPSSAIDQLVRDIQRYFAGERVEFFAVPIDLGSQEPFFAKVYTEVRKLGWGETTTYGAIAKILGEEPQAAREVGRAMATNPVPLIVPCHRVLAAGGKIGGFSAPGGAGSKTRMLEIEGVVITPEKAAAAAAAAAAAKKEQFGFGF